LLSDGKVLIAGGRDGFTTPMTLPLPRMTAVWLQSGVVKDLTGGNDPISGTTAASNQFQ